MRLGAGLSLAAGLLVAVLGCARRPAPLPYPHESVLTVVAELRIHLNQDPYRFAPGRDLTGANIYRTTLARLASLAETTGPAYADALAYAEAQCYERLGQWAEARAAFERAAAARTSLEAPARTRAVLAARMAEVTAATTGALTLEGYLNELEARDRKLLQWADEQPPWPYDAFIRLERQRALETLARLLFANRMVLTDGLERALATMERLVEQFEDGWRHTEHLLMLGGMYETLARDWVAVHPPEGPSFPLDGPWAEWVERARDAYRRVARADGDPAKPEGQARLRALDAWAVRIETLAR